jgi:anti-sigma B factor antagonist
MMKVNIKTLRQVAVVEIVGELDGKTAPEAQERVLPLVQPGCKIILDMTKVPYMSSAGLRLFLLLNRQVSSNKGRIALIGLSEEIRDTMDMTGFLNYFTIYETFDAGLDALAQ